MRVLLTSTSFIDTPGRHKQLLAQQGFEIDEMRGPLTVAELLPVIVEYDALLCGDDELTQQVLEKGKSARLKYISKYGVGLDKIDLKAAAALGLPVTNCPGVNQVSVAEHVFALLLCFERNVHIEYNITKAGGWKRFTGHEIYGKKIGVVGLGAIGKEVARRAKAFGLQVLVFDKFVDRAYAEAEGYYYCNTIHEMAAEADIITLHVPHTPETDNLINIELVTKHIKPGVILINTARGRLVNLQALKHGLATGLIGGYLADVLDVEPMPADYELKNLDNVLITPHIASRTFESVERQGLKAVENLIEMVNKHKMFAN